MVATVWAAAGSGDGEFTSSEDGGSDDEEANGRVDDEGFDKAVNCLVPFLHLPRRPG